MACPYLNIQWVTQAEMPGFGIFPSFTTTSAPLAARRQIRLRSPLGIKM
jgi:hypothetical protein